MTAVWRGSALIALLALAALAACLIVCRPARGGESGAGAPPQNTGTPDAGAASAPASKPAPAQKAPACPQMRRRVEQALTAARSCQASDECVVETFESTFRPCGLGVRKGAPLEQARADAKQYQDQCRPVVHPVKCPDLPRAICQRGQCVLAPPAAP